MPRAVAGWCDRWPWRPPIPIARSTVSSASSGRASSPASRACCATSGSRKSWRRTRIVTALERWPESGVPDNPGAWLMATAKRRAIDRLRRRGMLERKHQQLGRELEALQQRAVADLEQALDDPVGDDVLRLVFVVLPSGALDRGPRRADAAAPRRPDDRGDRPRVPRQRGDRGPAHRPRQADAGRGRRALRGAAGGGARRAAVVGARGRVPDLQRGLRGDGRRRLDAARAVRGRAPPGPGPRGARAGRAGGARARGAHGDPGLARRGARVGGGGARAAARPGPRALGPAADRARPRGARAGGGCGRRRARPLRAPGGDRGVPRAGAHGRGDGLGDDRDPLRRARASEPVAGRGAEPGRRARDGVRPGGGPRARRRAHERAVAPGLSPAAERARRSAREARPPRRGARGVGTGGLARPQHPRAGAAARSRGCGGVGAGAGFS